MRSTKSFRKYQRLYGPHFTKELCKFAVSLMEDDKGPITPITKEELEEKLRLQGIKLEYDTLYDAVYVANMCKADYLHSSIQNEAQLALYIKDVLDDPDGYDGISFVRWCADMEHTGVYIDWESFA